MTPPGRRRAVTLATVTVALVAIGWWASTLVTPARGQVDVTVERAMVKGSPAARVTIFEFSDYQ